MNICIYFKEFKSNHMCMSSCKVTCAPTSKAILKPVCYLHEPLIVGDVNWNLHFKTIPIQMIPSNLERSNHMASLLHINNQNKIK
jgi:hypothetical protein